MRLFLILIVCISIYPVLFILYLMMKNAGKLQDGCCFAVHMKKEWLETDAVKEVQKTYLVQLKRTVGILATIPFVSLLLPTVSIPFTICMVWSVAVCLVPFVPLVRANQRLKQWKRENGFICTEKHVTYTEMKHAGSVRKVKLVEFVPPMFLSAMAAGLGMLYFCKKDLAVYAGMLATIALFTVLFYGFAVWMDKQKTQVISSDSEVNLNYTRAKKQLWKKVWLWLAWLNTAYTISMGAVCAAVYSNVNWLLWGSLLYCILTMAVLVWFGKRLNELEGHYEAKRENIFEEDDDAWIGGVFYYNKRDKRMMVQKRLGIGTTMNLATPVGMAWTVLGIAALVFVIPVCCGWLMLEEFTPLTLAVKEEVLTAEHLGIEYEIPLAAIEHVELLTEKPNWKKLKGTAMDTICEGTFHIEGRKCEVFANPQNAVFMELQTAEQTYYMSAADDAATQEIYEEITEAWD